MKLLLKTLIFGSILATGTANAVTVLFEDFEDATVDYTFSGFDPNQGAGEVDEFQSSPVAPGIFEDYVGRHTYDSIDTFITPGALTNTQGDSFFGVQDSGGLGTEITLTWTGLDVSSFGTDYTFSAFFGEADDNDGNTLNNDWDFADSVTVWANLDGTGFQQILGIESTNDLTNTTPSIDSNFDGIGDGAEITNTLTQYSVNIGSTLGAASTLDLEIRIAGLASAHEDIAIDNVLIEGVIPEPSSTLLLGLGGLSLLARRKR